MNIETVKQTTNKMFDELEKLKLSQNSTGYKVQTAFREHGVFDAAMMFYEGALQYPSLREAKAHFKKRLELYNPHFYKGYFNKS